MKILCFEIEYIGFGFSKKLSPKNKRLILKIREEGLKNPYPDGSPGRINMVKATREITGASLMDAHEFCKKYTY